MSKADFQPLTHIPVIDGVRGLFCLSVILGHWDFVHFNSAWVAMGIFFIISGFLIGRILYHTKEATFKVYYKNYIINRFLRIFPLYYASIVVFFVIMYLLQDYKGLGFKSMWNFHAEHWEYYWFHGVNLIKVLNPLAEGKKSLFLAHYWSLSAEEQFYFLFPFLIFFVRGKALKVLLLCIIIGSPIFKYVSFLYLEQAYGTWTARYITYEVTIFWLDAFALGAALVVFDIQKIPKPKLLAIISICLTVSLGLVIYFLGKKAGMPFRIYNLGLDQFLRNDQLTGIWLVDYRFILMSWLVNVSVVLVILCHLRGIPLFKILLSKKLAFVGKRSYALYIIHFPILILGWKFKVINTFQVIHNPIYNIIGFIIYVAVLLVISDLIYRFYEKKFLRYKRKYQFSKS